MALAPDFLGFTQRVEDYISKTLFEKRIPLSKDVNLGCLEIPAEGFLRMETRKCDIYNVQDRFYIEHIYKDEEGIHIATYNPFLKEEKVLWIRELSLLELYTICNYLDNISDKKVDRILAQ